MESVCRGLSDRDVARAAMGHGRPFAACPRSADGANEPAMKRSVMQGRMPGAFSFAYFSLRKLEWSTNSGHWIKFFLGNCRRQPFIELMRTYPVVSVHQVVTDISMRFCQSHVSGARYPLAFQAAKQPLHWCVVPAVSTSAHALLHPIAPQPLPVQAATVLTTLIRVKHYMLRPSTLFISHIKRPDDKLSIRLD